MPIESNNLLAFRARNKRCSGPNNGRGRKSKVIFSSAQLGGNRNSNGSFNNLGDNGNYWSATENGSDNAWNYNYNRNNGKLNRNNNNKAWGFSCRCVQDSHGKADTGFPFFNDMKANTQLEEKLLLDLFQAYYNARSNKRNTANALQFEVQYEERLFALWKEIRDRQYQIGRSICFINFKPVQREIFAADFRDRIVHHLIFNYLNPLVEPGFIKDSYSCREGKGTHYGIQRMRSFIRGCSQNYTQDAWILKLDILGYFMCIDRQLLFNMICRKIEEYKRPVAFEKSLLIYLLEKVIFNDPTINCLIKGHASDWRRLPPSKSLFNAPKGKGFPIGNLTSQLFGNIYLSTFDHFVKEELGFQYYGRYVDDFILIHPEKEVLRSAILPIRSFLTDRLQLDLHPRKIYLQHYTKGVQFLGTYLKPHRTYVSPRIKNNFFQTIQSWNDVLQKNGNKIGAEELSRFIASMNSYLGILKHYDTYKLRKKMLGQLSAYFWNFVFVSGGYTKLVPKRRRKKMK